MDGTEVRISPAVGGVVVDPADATSLEHVAFLLGLPFDLAGFWAWARNDPVLGALAGLLGATGRRCSPTRGKRW